MTERGVGPAHPERPVGIGPDAMATLRRVSEQGGTGEGLFEYSAEQLGSLILRWQQLADEYAEDVRAIHPLADIEAPAADPASERHAARAREPGRALLESLSQRRDYCQAQADKCRRARGDSPDPEFSAPEPGFPVSGHDFPVAERGFPVAERDFPSADQDAPFDPDVEVRVPAEWEGPRHGVR